ncbi:MAG TPA: APA family fibronectin-binding glycoprotein [Mycobacterium sp.]|jgi:hypothetical protein|nr:APA family fibronectin-binding glycoprotein [Mycobacterium sp.]
MHEPDAIPEHRKRRAKTLAMATLAGATAVALTLPSVAQADPEPSPPPNPPPSGNTFLQGPPADPNAPPPPAGEAPPPADPNAPPPAADPNAPPADPNAPPADPNAAPPPPPQEPGRVDNAAGGFSYVVPAGWKVSDARQLSYGQALLTKIGAEGATPQQPQQQQPGQTPQPVNDTSVLLGRLDMKLFAGAEADNGKAATRLASDMGEFFMPFPGTRVNQQNGPLTAGDMPGAFSSYDVKFTDTNKPVGQIWAGVVGNATLPAPRGQRNERWFVVWLGSANNPIDKGAAATLASSIRPWTPPPPPEPDPNAPPAPNVNAGPNAPQQRPEVGVARPVDPGSAPPEMAPPAG